MPIISISLNDPILKEVDSLQDSHGFSGRSEIIRTALRTLLAEEKARSALEGQVEGILLVSKSEHSDDLSPIRHQFNDIILTEIHNHLKSHKCLHIFVIAGTAKKVKEMIRQFQVSKAVDYTKFIVS